VAGAHHQQGPPPRRATWVLPRVPAARLCEVLALDETSVELSRPSVTLVGKGGGVREIPVHAPILATAQEMAAARPGTTQARSCAAREAPASTGTVSTSGPEPCTRTRSGPADMTWRCTCFGTPPLGRWRILGGAHSLGAALYLGQKPASSLGTIAGYLQTIHADPVDPATTHRGTRVRCPRPMADPSGEPGPGGGARPRPLVAARRQPPVTRPPAEHRPVSPRCRGPLPPKGSPMMEPARESHSGPRCGVTASASGESTPKR
jgi:hypothetical protein